MWNWCTILLLIILIMFLVIVIIAASCFCAINIKKGNERRNPPSDLYPFPMDLYPTSQRSFVAPPRDNRIESTAPVTYSQQSMPMLTPYQQYIIAQNWSNLYRAYQQNQNQGIKQKT
ncbi:uncharacterized protein LOC106069825 isoform X2 [Biomphalaria glabrata]|uniref:Uncharacterized protein LOC106069825 isoform X2 n=1 Tax=Biomphalaria glabrata TaxID=6526 RepID=A0A9W2ZEB8_BIOGL|nr:uncharacterized protein LOC106069825 isoform X2 [Biomphalaria glabrata]XP_055873289.1 uncharacterized protein LOC106069825 isoform X2 [Biomphalaria glabrata]KAI8752088.1 hypothetical protein BgiMline_014806 [Biomphalaria glabrata]